MISSIIDELLKLRTPAMITITVSAIVFVVLFIKMSNFNLTGKNAKVLGLFVGLSRRSAFHLCFAWCKYLYFISILCSMQYASIGHYLIIGLLVVVCAFMAKEKRLITMESVGGGLCLASIWVCSVFIEYINSVKSDIYVLTAYWIIVLFMVICSTVVFLYEILNISEEREAFETSITKK